MFSPEVPAFDPNPKPKEPTRLGLENFVPTEVQEPFERDSDTFVHNKIIKAILPQLRTGVRSNEPAFVNPALDEITHNLGVLIGDCLFFS